jgi:hypothetical protein
MITINIKTAIDNGKNIITQASIMYSNFNFQVLSFSIYVSAFILAIQYIPNPKFILRITKVKQTRVA